MTEFSPRLHRAFLRTLAAEQGAGKLPIVMESAGLPALLADFEAASTMDAFAAAQAYADIQKAMRTYYGRGARGILLRVGARLWQRVLDEAPLTMRPRIPIARGLATAANPKPALDLLARIFSSRPGDLTVHTLDLDLLLVDHPSPAANGQQDDEPICWVTMGLIREALYWAAHHEFDVTEIACRALGAKQCEFKIVSAGKS
jgi:predicted hydrocarbon binding protein